MFINLKYLFKLYKMKPKNLVLNLLLLSVFLLSIISVSAATGTVNMTVPVDASLNSGTIILNVTNVTTGFDEMVNCTFTIASSLTANTSVTIGTFDNHSLINVNATLDTLTLEDANDYLVTASCRNSTNDEASDTATITIDNKVPTAPSSPSPANLGSIITPGTQTFSQTVIGANTTSCTYTLNKNGQDTGVDSISGSSTHTGNTCSFTKDFSTSADNGNWCWTQTASDETNTSASAQACVSVGIPGSSGGLPKGRFIADESGTILAIGADGIFGEDAKIIWWIIGIVVAILIIWLIVWLVRR